MRAWLIEQALQGKDWTWVKANKEGINIAGDVEDIDLSKRINRKLYFQICRLLGAETPPDEPDESEGVPQNLCRHQLQQTSNVKVAICLMMKLMV